MEMGIAEVENTYMMQSPWLLLTTYFTVVFSQIQDIIIKRKIYNKRKNEMEYSEYEKYIYTILTHIPLILAGFNIQLLYWIWKIGWYWYVCLQILQNYK